MTSIDNDKGKWVSKNWLVAVLVSLVVLLLAALGTSQGIMQADQANRLRIQEDKTAELEKKVASLESGQERILAGLNRVETKVDKIIDLHVKP